MWPVTPARISQKFAAPGSYASHGDAHGRAGHHTGIDFGSAWPKPINKTLVRSIMPGEVVISEYNSTMGNWVGVYNHKHGLLVTYWHMSGRLVRDGSWVQVYAPIGRVGSTGNSTAPHLHLQMNRGPYFSYNGHAHPAPALKAYTRKEARTIFRNRPHHSRA